VACGLLNIGRTDNAKKSAADKGEGIPIEPVTEGGSYIPSQLSRRRALESLNERQKQICKGVNAS